jgi:hypothetical protein
MPSLFIGVDLRVAGQLCKTVEVCLGNATMASFCTFDDLQNISSYLGLHVKCPILLSDFKQISSFPTDFLKIPEYQIS